MSKITIRFTQDTVALDDVYYFYNTLYRSLGLKADNIFEEQEFEITAQTKVTLFGMATSVPQGLQTERSWVCRLIVKEGMILFSVGDWIWAAALWESSQPQEIIAKLPLDLPALSLAVFEVNTLPALSRLRNLTSLNLSRCISLVDISALAGLSSLASLNLSWCKSLVDISALSSLNSLTSLNLSSCKSLVDVSALSGLSSLTSLSLSRCESLADISALSGLSSLTSLDLSQCESLVDISALAGLKRLTSLDISRRISSSKSFVDISVLSGLRGLTSLNLSWCKSLVELSALSSLNSLTSLNLSSCKSLVDISALSSLNSLTSLNLSSCNSLVELSALSGLNSLTSLSLSRCESLADISALSGLSSLTSLDLSQCESLADISALSGLSSLTSLDLSQCESLVDISALSGLSSLAELNLDGSDLISDLSPLYDMKSLSSLSFTSRRIQTIECLREIQTLREVKEFNPPEVAEVLAHTAYLRADRACIKENKNAWLTEAKNWRRGAQSLQDRFATTLGDAFSLLGADPIAEDYQAFLDSRPDFSSAPWKAWFGGTLKESGFALYRQRVERVAVSQMLPSAIGGACTTLPYEDQPDWSRQWLMSLEIARLSDAKNLLAVAPGICLAHARLNLSESLRRWLEAFTDPSDPGALDPVHAALAGFQLGLNHLDAAESHVFAIESPSLRDPVLADLISSYHASDTDRTSAQLLLVAAPATRRELAKTLVTIPEYSSSEVAMQRLVVAMDDSPEALGELIALLPPSSAPSQIIQQISASLQLDRQATLRKISQELHQQADRLLTSSEFLAKVHSVNIQH
jgi:Leucine-rich repeat (LRR) protein